MSGISALTIAGPDVAAVADALCIISGQGPATWYPAVVASTGEEGRTCVLQVGDDDVVEVFEVPNPVVAAPESLTLSVPDPSGAVTRLRAAGYRVIEHQGLPVAATVSVAGVCIRIRGAR